ncbi:uncharacterized protein [Nicotiana sylvestris]|uniref:uncharacterized protein n=1 Tax=Nicotiana sylvestris TaxID=4096 RepID=UPI00388CABAE
MKAQALADYLAENLVDEEYKPLRTYFPDEEIMYVDEVDHDEKPGWKLFFDGAANMKGVVHGDLIHSFPSELHTMSTHWPFVAWGMNVIGPIEPTASNGHRFIMVAIDYFSKWVEVVTFKSVAKKAVFKIMHRKSTLYRPKVNGAIEVVNKNKRYCIKWCKVLGNGMKSCLLPYWVIALLFTLQWVQLLLVYGTEAVIPVEVEISSLRIIAKAKIDDDEWVKTRLEQLSLIDEKRLAVVCHGQLYQKRMARAYNKKVEAKGKFALNWQGPFMVTRVLPNGALYLTDIEGKCVYMAINCDAVKKYYA